MMSPALQRHRGRHAGVGMIEVLIALFIGTILIAGVVQLFIGSRRTYQMNEEMSRLQENGRFAIMQMARDIRMTGYQGCGHRRSETMSVNIIASDAPDDVASFFTDDVIEGENDVGGNHALDAREGTDTLRVRFARPDAPRLAEQPAPNNANVKVINNRPDIQQGDIAFVSDCVTADAFRVTNVVSSAGGNTEVTVTHGMAGNTDNRLSKPYGADALLMLFTSREYFVRDTDTVGLDGQPVYALYRQTLDAPPERLVDGVENLQVLYGEDITNNGFVDRFRDASSANMRDVIAVRIALLASASAPVKDEAETRTYDLLGTDVTPDADRRLRMVFNATITLRNREVLSAEL